LASLASRKFDVRILCPPPYCGKLEPVSRASANVRNNDSNLIEPIDAA
jgi:hypothetical protein